MTSSESLRSWLALGPTNALERVRRERTRRAARGSLAEFIRAGWHVLEPSTPLEWNWHIDAVAVHLQAMLYDWSRKQADPGHVQRIQNLLVNIPPGTGKSRIVSVFAPAWMWLHEPGWRAIFLSANPRVALRDSLYCRDLIESAWYRETFKIEWDLSDDQNAKGLFKNNVGGFRQALGITGKITGDRGDALFVDDPNDAGEVLSDQVRNTINERWDDKIYNRVNDLRTSIRVGIMQRLHVEDWSGHVLAGGDWEHVCLPMEFDPSRARTTAIGWRDPRSEEGELLFPKRFPPEVLAKERRRLGPYGYAGQHQQLPSPREGGMFQAQWFEVVDAVPCVGMQYARYWDKAGARPGKGDWTVGALLAKSPDGLTWVVDIVRGQWPPDERNKVIRQTAELDRQVYGSVKIYVEQVPGLGKESTDNVLKLLSGFNVEADRVSKEKSERAEGLSAQARAGNVRMKRSGWNVPYLAVMCAFPNGAHDDDVDASSGAFNKLNLRPKGGTARGGGARPSVDNYRAT